MKPTDNATHAARRPRGSGLGGGALVRLACLCVVLASPSARAQPLPDLPHTAVRGVTVGPIESSQQPGRGYGTPTSAALLDELVRLGVNTISLTPFGRIWSLTSTDIQMDFEAPYPENRQAVRRMIAQAHARGLRVVLIPHLWVETGGWRGEIDPGSPEAWRRYRASYRDFILAWANDAASFGADAFSIGVECASWSGRFGAFWRGLISEVREVFHGPLTYSSNWDETDGVLFWDQLDWIGVNAFYPLSDHANASYATYAAGARAAITRVKQEASALGMPVLLIEIGYTTRADAAVEPWLWPDDMQGVRVDEWEQARALAALAGEAARTPWIVGFLVWRYYANLDDVSQEAIWGFSPHGKLAEPVLEAIFGARWAADAEPTAFGNGPLAPRDRAPHVLEPPLLQAPRRPGFPDRAP